MQGRCQKCGNMGQMKTKQEQYNGPNGSYSVDIKVCAGGCRPNTKRIAE